MQRTESAQRAGDSTNRILTCLSTMTQRRLWPALQRVSIRKGDVLNGIGRGIRHLYFIERGMVSLIRPMRDGQAVEIGAVGPEGLSPPSAMFAIDQAIFESVVEIPGTALRITRENLRSNMAHDSELTRILNGYGAVALSQLAQTAACNMLHTVEQRCCRWILVAHDAALSTGFPLTHESLALMLGIRRASVTIAAEALQSAGLIQYSHGKVAVTDRQGLENAACECYRTIRDEFDALFSRFLKSKEDYVRNRTE